MTVGANVSTMIAFWPERLDPPARAGKPMDAVLPAMSLIVPPLSAKADVDETSKGLAV